jgi:hypothetical protein
MAENQVTSKRRMRFSMRALLLVVLVLAITLWAGLEIVERYNSFPLSDAIDNFNTSAQGNIVGKYEPPLTESEVITSIKSQLPTLESSEQVKSIYRRIVNTRRLPKGADFHAIPAFQPRNGPQQIVWWINLEVSTGKNTGYGLRIRETDDPVWATNQTATTSVTSPDKVQLSEFLDGKSESN